MNRATTGVQSVAASIAACPLCASGKTRPVWRRGEMRVEKCLCCGVLYTVERPTDEEAANMYDVGALISERPDPAAPVDGPVPAWKLEEQMALLDAILLLGGKGALLDVGCFTGMFLRNAKRRGFDVVGIEPNRVAFQYVRDALHFDVFHGSLLAARFPLEKFSAVSFLDVIEHVPDPLTELKEVWRILRPGGVLVLATPNVTGLPQRVVKTKRWLLRQDWCPIDDVPWHLWGFTRSSLSLCVQKAGFIVKEMFWLKPSPLTTNPGAGSSLLKRLALRLTASISYRLAMSDRMALLAQKADSRDS